MTSLVSQVAAAQSLDAVAHFKALLAFETDCWDVHESMATGTADFVLLDVRGEQAFAGGHIAGAVHFPHADLTAPNLLDHPKDQLFVVYCAGPHCNGADKAGRNLALLGRPVKKMIGGVTGWIDEGFTLTSARIGIYSIAMSAFADRPNTALLVIDVQNDVVASAHDRGGVIANIDQLVSRARDAGSPVVWVQHNDDDLPAGSHGWKIVPELAPKAGEAIVHKSFRDSFEDTNLEAELADQKIGRLIVTGAQTDFCVRWTLHGALGRGYDTVLVADAHTTDAVAPDGMPTGASLVAHTNATWGTQAVQRCSTEVTAAAAIEL